MKDIKAAVEAWVKERRAAYVKSAMTEGQADAAILAGLIDIVLRTTKEDK